jgi:hypothetical protein
MVLILKNPEKIFNLTKCIHIAICIFNNSVCQSKIPCRLPTVRGIVLSTSIKTLQLAHSATSSKERQIRAYSVGLLIPGKLGCPKKKKLRKN